MELDRRSLLGRGIAWLTGAAAVLLTGRFVLPLGVRDLGKLIQLGPASSMPQGASRYLAETDIHLIHDAEGIYAISGRCTHLGCSVLRQPEGFSCPCHGARFDLLGKPVSGPAVKTLAWYRITVTDRRRLVLHLDQTVEPGTRTRI